MSSEIVIYPSNNEQSRRNLKKKNIQNNADNNLENKLENDPQPSSRNNIDSIKSFTNQTEQIMPSPSSSPGVGTSSALKTFITSKKGIILLSIIGTIVVASAVVVPVVVAQTSKEDENEETNTNLSTDNISLNEEEELENYYYSEIISLTQNNMVEYTKFSEYERSPPSEYKYESFGEKIIYDGDNSAINGRYSEVLAENKKLIASENTYDEIDSNGKLYLKGIDIGKNLYKHIFSDGQYGGNISPAEKALSMKIRINPISLTNYITGLYAPPGEVIKIEISSEDLKNIGGKISFIIGQATQSDGVSENIEAIGIKRVLNLVNKMTIEKTVGYIGTFIGGPIYISNPSIKNQFTVTISNAVPYKHILFGITTKEQFENMESYSAPFFELDVYENQFDIQVLYLLLKD